MTLSRNNIHGLSKLTEHSVPSEKPNVHCGLQVVTVVRDDTCSTMTKGISQGAEEGCLWKALNFVHNLFEA